MVPLRRFDRRFAQRVVRDVGAQRRDAADLLPSGGLAVAFHQFISIKSRLLVELFLYMVMAFSQLGPCPLLFRRRPHYQRGALLFISTIAWTAS